MRNIKTIYIVLLLVMAALLMTSCTPGFKSFRTIDNAPDEWRMFRNSLNGYYQKGVYGADLTKLLWRGDLKARSYSSPVATESYVAVAALDNNLYFFDLETGERINIYKFDAPLSRSPLISNKIIYAASGHEEDFIAGINLITGKSIFREPMADVHSPIIGDEKHLYVGDYSGKFVCMDKFAGKVFWDFRAGDAILNAPAVHEGRVFFGSLDQKMYGLDLEDGSLLWSHDVGGAINSAPAVDSLVYFGSYDYNVYALRASDGEMIWQFPTEGHVLSSAVIDDSNVYIGSNDRNLYCLSKLNGELQWKFKANGIINSTPLVLEDVVVFGSGGGSLYILDKFSGTELYSYKTGHQIKSTPIYYDNKIFISSLDKRLYCFGKQ